jgi:hypothetical protein
MKEITDQQADAIYDILVQECGALEDGRLSFVSNQTTDFIGEWRFCGKLGFGGKFWRNNGRMYVSCYHEDLTKERVAMITAANDRLAALVIQ